MKPARRAPPPAPGRAAGHDERGGARPARPGPQLPRASPSRRRRLPRVDREVAAVVAWANRERVPVVPFGAGTSLEGHVNPLRGGISLDLTRMGRVLEVRPGDLTARVQAGTMRTVLEAAAGEQGLFFPVDQGPTPLGGMAATNASGTTTVR